MRDLCRLIGWMVVDLIRSRVMLEAEIWTLRQQINVLRAASPSHTAVVQVILQRGPYASILGEGYAGLARRRADRAHSLPPSSRRSAPPIYPDLIYDRHSATDPWRVAQARDRNRADQCGQVYGHEARTTVARLEDFPSQSCRRHRCDRSVRRADNLVSSALWTADRGAQIGRA